MKRIGIISILAAAALVAGCIMFPPSKPKPQIDAPSPAAVLREHPPQTTLAPPTPAEAQTAAPEAPPLASTPPANQENACHIENYQSLVGQTLTSAVQSSLPANSRVICMGCMANMIFIADRLTIQMGPNNTIASVRCG